MPAGSNVDLGLYYRQSGLSAGSLNADLVPAQDVSNYKLWSLYIGQSAYEGTLSFQASFDIDDDNSWHGVKTYDLPGLAGASGDEKSTSDTDIIIGGPIWFPYFRVRMTSYVDGEATGVFQLHRDGLPGFQLLSTAVYLLPRSQFFGLTNNDGIESVAITAGKSTDTVVLSGAGMLCQVLVTSAGSHEVDFYDNASSSSGTIVDLITSTNAAILGYRSTPRSPVANGIVVKGNASNPGMTVFYSNLHF